MTPWTYRDYRQSVEYDVTQGIEQLGFNVDQSIGYASNELALRLDEFPDENVMALTALAIAANQRGSLFSYSAGDELYDELVDAYSKEEHLVTAAAIENLTQKNEFLQDVDVVSKTLGLKG